MTEVQCVDRQQHMSPSGIEIQRTLNVKPFEDFPKVLKALQGSVTSGVGPVRTLPARDSYLPNCYCAEALVAMIDPAQLSSAPDMMAGVDPNEVGGMKKILETVKEAPSEGHGPSIITAKYRPLITAAKPKDNGEPADDAFDWVDPTYQLTYKTMAWPEGLVVATRDTEDKFIPRSLDDESGKPEPIVIPVLEISIRRLLIPVPNWDIINGCAGCVNKDEWPDQDKYNFPKCPPGTLRFDGPQIDNRLDSEGNRIYEIRLTFSKICLDAEPVFDREGRAADGLAPVTWNHVLMRPYSFGTRDYQLGWYYSSRRRLCDAQVADWFVARVEGDAHSGADFSKLFWLNPGRAGPQ